jgi:dolichol-phosphate mannosyltransferase
MTSEASGVWSRFAKSFLFNNIEALVRIPVIALLVTAWHLSSVIAAAITLAVAFIVRFMFHSLVVYAPRRAETESSARRLVDEIDKQAVSPGEL